MCTVLMVLEVVLVVLEVVLPLLLLQLLLLQLRVLLKLPCPPGGGILFSASGKVVPETFQQRFSWTLQGPSQAFRGSVKGFKGGPKGVSGRFYFLLF